MSLSRLRVACLQLCSSESIDDNLSRISRLLSPYQSGDFDLILLPENATLLTQRLDLRKQAASEGAQLQVRKQLASIAKTYGAWLVAGSVLAQDRNNPDKLLNRSLVFSPRGELIAHYDKIHLFDADLSTEAWQESAHISAGASPTQVAMDEVWQLGLSICYDLRFPELYRHYSKHGCNLLTVPAAFTVPTGKAHWQTLLTARAIENQAYVLAAAQWGKHQDGRQTYGHSMIIDPWGNKLAELSQGEGVITATLSLQHLLDIRRQLPALKHRKL